MSKALNRLDTACIDILDDIEKGAKDGSINLPTASILMAQISLIRGIVIGLGGLDDETEGSDE